MSSDAYSAPCDADASTMMASTALASGAGDGSPQRSLACTPHAASMERTWSPTIPGPSQVSTRAPGSPSRSGSDGPAFFAMNTNVNVDPCPSRLSTVNEPPSRRLRRSEIASPSPAPPIWRFGPVSSWLKR